MRLDAGLAAAEVELDSPAWKLLEHRLRTACRSSSVVLTAAWAGGASAEGQGIEAWVSEPNAGHEGLQAYAGTLTLPLLGRPRSRVSGASLTAPPNYTLMLVRLRVQRPLLREDAVSGTIPAQDELPEGYDALLERVKLETARMPGDIATAGTSLRPAFCYTVFDRGQVEVLFRAEFTLDTYAEREILRRRHIVPCHGCDQPAAVFSQTEGFALCVACDAEMHSHKLRQNMVRVDINSVAALFHISPPTCEVSGKRGGWYDTVDEAVVCVDCKMTGKYSRGEPATRKLLPLQEAYESAVRAARPLAGTDGGDAAGHLRAELLAIQDGVRAMHRQYERVCAEADASAEAVKARAWELTSGVLAALTSAEAECGRQLEHVEATDTFLEYMQHVVTPEGYLASHKQHQLLRAHLAGQTCAQRPGMREVERSVQPLKLAGHLSVVLGDAAPEPEASPEHSSRASPERLQRQDCRVLSAHGSDVQAQGSAVQAQSEVKSEVKSEAKSEVKPSSEGTAQCACSTAGQELAAPKTTGQELAEPKTPPPRAEPRSPSIRSPYGQGQFVSDLFATPKSLPGSARIDTASFRRCIA